MTPDGFEKLKKELQHIKAVERPKIVKEIEEAMAHGDLSENAEYHAAKEKLAHLNGRMQDFEVRISKAEIIDPKSMKGNERVMFGAHVTLLDVEQDSEITYQIVGEHESDIQLGRISVTSPIARGLIAKSEGDSVKITTPKGVKEFEIVGVEYK